MCRSASRDCAFAPRPGSNWSPAASPSTRPTTRLPNLPAMPARCFACTTTSTTREQDPRGTDAGIPGGFHRHCGRRRRAWYHGAIAGRGVGTGHRSAAAVRRRQPVVAHAGHAADRSEPDRDRASPQRYRGRRSGQRAFGARIEKLVARGLRAQLTTANFLTGLKVISLDMVHDAPPARIEQVDGYAQLPSGSSTDLADILASVQEHRASRRHGDRGTGARTRDQGTRPHAHQSRSRHRRSRTADQTADRQPARNSRGGAAHAAGRDQHAWHQASSGTDLPRLIRELTEAARSIRALTDYLDQHPEALLRGRKGDDK